MTIIWYGILSQGAPYNPIGQLCLGIFHPKKKKKKKKWILILEKAKMEVWGGEVICAWCDRKKSEGEGIYLGNWAELDD